LYLDAVLSRDMEMKLYSPASKDKNRLSVKGNAHTSAGARADIRQSIAYQVL